MIIDLLVIIGAVVLALVAYLLWPERGEPCDGCLGGRAFTPWQGQMLCNRCLDELANKRPPAAGGRL